MFDKTYGVCIICFGALTDDNIFVDETGDSWHHHKGVCAYMAGEVAVEHKDQHERLLAAIHAAKCGPDVFNARRAYYTWLKTLELEDHFDMSGPS